MLRILRGWMDRYLADEEAVLLILIAILSLFILITMGQVLAPMIASIIIAFLFQGLVLKCQRWGLSQSLAAGLASFVLLASLAAFFFLLLPVIWQQVSKLIADLPRMVNEAEQYLTLLPQRYPDLVSEATVTKLSTLAEYELAVIGQGLLTVSLTSLPVLMTALVYLILVPILVFFFLKDSQQILAWLADFLPKKRPVMSRIWSEMNQQIANYVRGKVVEIIIVAVVSYIAFAFLGLKYALLLAIAVGLSVLIPYIGAAVVTLPVAMVGLFQWGWESQFFYLLLVYGIIQALDGNVLVPLLFSEAVNLHPVAIILAVLVFGGLWGFWGVFFAIPLATLLKAVLNAWPRRWQSINSDDAAATIETAD